MIGRLRWLLGQRRVKRLATPEILDRIHPDDVEPVARYLRAMCSSRPGQKPSDFALAALLWLVYGEIEMAAMPAGSHPLDDKGRAGLPPPYRNRTSV